MDYPKLTLYAFHLRYNFAQGCDKSVYFFIKMCLIQPTQVGFVWVAPLFQSEGDLADSKFFLLSLYSILGYLKSPSMRRS